MGDRKSIRGDVISYRSPSASVGGTCSRLFFPREDSQPIFVMRLLSIESSYAPSHNLWGSKALLYWRAVLWLYFISGGIFFGLVEKWHKGGIKLYPPVFLHNWGSFAVAVYYTVALLNSIHGVQCEMHCRIIPLSRRWRWITAIQMFLFELTLVLETLISIVYGSFNLKSVCKVGCLVNYGLGNAALVIELCISRMPIRPNHVLLTIIYPNLWIVSQLAWFYTDHPPAYPGTMKSRNNIIVSVILGSVAFVVVHFFFWVIALARDKVCEGWFYPVDEGKVVDHPLPRNSLVPPEVGTSSQPGRCR